MKPKQSKNVTHMHTQHIQPKSENQDLFLNAIRNNTVIVGIGPAGVGKTYLAVNEAINSLSKNSSRNIILSRSNMPTGRSLGSFPGDIKDKIEPWLAPMITEAKKRLGTSCYENQYRLGNIQYQPLETIRGCSFNNSDILFDEAQNLTYEEVKAITTRIGDRSRLVLMGDPFQSDLRQSGLMQFVDVMQKHGVDIPVVRFTADDIVRSDIVRDIVIALLKEHGDPYDQLVQ